MLIKILIFIALIVMLGSLFRGLIFLVKDQGKTRRTVNALTVRVVAAAALIVLIVVGIKTGAIQPHGLTP